MTPSADPYQHFRFKVRWEGRVVAGFHQMTAPRLPIPVVRHEGAAAAPAPAACEPITLERGVIHDAEFAAWAQSAWLDAVPGRSASDDRKDLVFELFNEAGQLVLRYNAARCWVSAFERLPDLDSDAVAILSMQVDHEGWTRDMAVTEPAEPPEI